MNTTEVRSSTLIGRVVTGIGQGKFLTQLEWARRQFVDKLDIDPYPGTLNLIVDEPTSVEIWNCLRETSGVRIDNPNDGPNDCDARCYPVSIHPGIDAAIVLPELSAYSPVQIEIIAVDGLRGRLGIHDGDSLMLVLK